MSQSFQRVAGALLLVLACGLGWLVLVNPGGANARVALRIAGGVGAVGLVLLALGLRNPLRPEDRSAVRRVFAPANVAAGLVISALGVGVLWLFYRVVNVMPRIVVIGALTAIPGGLVVAAQIFANACAACGARLRPARPRGRAVEYCPGCGAVAVVFEKEGPVVLRGDDAHALAEEARASGAKGTAASVAAPARSAGRVVAPGAAEPAPAQRPARAAGAACLLLALGAAAFGVHAVRARSALERLWDEGAHARSAEIRASTEATRVFGVTVFPWYTYRLDVRYVDAAGAEHAAQERVDSVWEELRPEVARVVRHDRADPGVFVSSWAASFTYGPRISEGLAFAVAAALAGAGLQILFGRAASRPAARRGA